MNTVKNGKVAVMVNDQIGPYFETKKWLRQGDPMSPMLFNFSVGTLTLTVKKACECGLIKVLVDEYIEEGVGML